MFVTRYAVLAALCTLAVSAQNYRGKVTLPVETHWGTFDLQPGDYTITTDTIATMPVIHVTGNGTSAFILATTRGIEEGQSGHIELSEVNGMYAVTKLTAGSANKEFSFQIPKSVKKAGFGAVALKKAVLPVN